MDGNNEGSQSAQRQVRLKLTTRHEDIALPASTGPILVPTGKKEMKGGKIHVF